MRILVVDDHLPTIDLMRLTLTSFGHVVRCASSVDEALDLLGAEVPDVIVSDLLFSGGGGGSDGTDLARAVRARHDDGIGLLAVTGDATPAARLTALDSGFDDLVLKPFDVATLIDRIERLAPHPPP